MKLHVTPICPDILWHEFVTRVKLRIRNMVSGYVDYRELIRTFRR